MTDASLLARLEAVTARLEGFASQLKSGGAAPAAGGDSKGEVSEKVVAFDAYYAKDVAAFIEVAKKFKDTARIAELTERGFKGVRAFLDAAANCKKPAQAELQSLITPLSSTIQDADKNVDVKNAAFFPHMKAFAEGISLLQWVLGTSPKPVIEGAFESADFYLIKILTAAKNMTGDDQKNHRDFVAKFKAVITGMKEYAVANHKAGVDWNGRGVALSAYKPAGGSGSGGAPAAPAAPAAPSAPEAPSAPSAPDAPSDVPSAAPSGGAGSTGGMSAVFAAISSGADSKSATEAFKLKKVDKSQMTHKNPALREAGGLQPKAKEPKAAPAAAAQSKTQEKKVLPPRLELDKGTWFCENFEGKDMEVPEVQMKQNVYISKCKNLTITIPDKVKSISVDKCERVRVVFKAVVSTFEVVNSQRVYASCLEACPSFAIDKSSGVSVIVSRAALNQVPAPPEIVTSNISECNLVVPGATDDVDPVEIPIPEQYITKYNKQTKKITTENVTHGG